MQKPPALVNDAERLDALRRLDILDTPAEQDFDDITAFASCLCGTPIALISLVDGARQWFKSKVGIDVAETDRDSSFCAHAIQGDRLFEVNDTLLDDRFFDNPLVVGGPEIRFYAGAPLITNDGFRLGTVCVIDRVPRTLTAAQRTSLEALSRQVIRQLEFRTLSRQLATTSRKLVQISALQTAVLNSPDMAMISVTGDGMIVSFSQAAGQLLGVDQGDVVGVRTLTSFYALAATQTTIAPDIDLAEASNPMDFSFLTSVTPQGLAGSGAWWMRRGDGTTVLARIGLTAVLDADATLLGFLAILHDVTALRKAQSLFESSQAFLRTVAERVPGVIFQLRRRPDGSACFPYASSGLGTLYGIHPDEVRDDTAAITSRIHPDDRAATSASLELSARTLSPWQHENRIALPDGKVRWVYVNGVPEAEADGSILWNGFITDITDQKEAETAFEDNRHFLQTLVANLPVGIYSKRMRKDDISLGGEFHIWNAAAERMSGIPASQIIGRTDSDVFPATVSALHAAHDRDLIRSGEAVVIPAYSLSHPDGTTRLLRMTSIPVFDAQGDLEYIMGISEDLTDVLTHEKELIQRTAELEAVNDASPLGLFRTDAEGACVYVNRTFELMVGLSATDCLGDGWRSTVHPDDYAAAVTNWRAAVQSKSPFSGVHRCLLASGKTVVIQARCAPVIVGDAMIGYVGTFDDITLRRAANQAIAANEKRMRLITDNVPGTIGYINADERFEFCNVHYKSMLGLDQETMIGKTLLEAFGTTTYAIIEPRVREVLKGISQSFERTMVINGAIKYHQCEYISDIDSDGRVAGFYALVTDVTSAVRPNKNWVMPNAVFAPSQKIFLRSWRMSTKTSAIFS